MEKLRVLIPTDFTIQAEFAYILVNKLGERTPVEIHFLHVMNVPDTVYLDLEGRVQTCGEIDPSYVELQKSMADRKLSELKKQYGDQVQTHLVFGKTTDAILEYAEKNAFDLIAMGTKGSWGIREKLSGSETQLVARRSSIPVLSLMCDRSDLEIRNILLVHDFSDPIEQDLGLLKKIVAAFGPVVHLLQIQRSGGQETAEAIRSLMERFAQRHGLENTEFNVLQDTDVEHGVIHFNEMSEMDVICIGTHGKGGVFHSSATEKLINHMYKPIISFHLKN